MLVLQPAKGDQQTGGSQTLDGCWGTVVAWQAFRLVSVDRRHLGKRVCVYVCVFTLQKSERAQRAMSELQGNSVAVPMAAAPFSYISHGLMLVFLSDILNQTAIGCCICGGFISCPPTS